MESTLDGAHARTPEAVARTDVITLDPEHEGKDSEEKVSVDKMSNAQEDERARLLGFVDCYVDALGAHEPHRLPIAPHFRFSENAQALPLGSGLWRTIRGVHPGGQRFVDVERGEVAYWGVVEEIRGPSMLGARMRIEGRQLSELETLLVRGGLYFQPEVVEAPTARLHEVLRDGERGGRDALVSVAHAYFDAIEQSNGNLLSVAPDCKRIVNGVSDSDADPTSLEEGEAHRGLHIVEQMSEAHYAYIEEIRERRFPLVDLERGLVHSVVLFDHPGDLARANGEVPFGAPNTMLYFEVFKVRGGVLSDVWAIGTNTLPYGISSGWARP